MISAIVFGTLILFLLLGAPVFTILSGIALFGFYLGGMHMSIVGTEVFRLSSNPVLISIPLFTFAGFVLGESKAPERMVKFCQAILGWVPGGLAIVTVFTCAFFTAFNGASGVTIIVIGGLLYPALLSEKYPERFSLGLVTTGGCLGLLFAPSIPLILYGIIAKQPVFDMFVAGFLPCLVVLCVFSIYSMLRAAYQYKIQRTSFHFRTLGSALWLAKWELMIPVIVLGGIYSSIFAVSEAAAITAFYVFVVEVLIFREISLQRLIRVMGQSMIMVGGILIIVASAISMANFLIDAEVPTRLFKVIVGNIHSKFMFLLCLNGFVLILGVLIDIFSATVIVVPLLVPVAQQYDINLVHLGIIFLANMAMGYQTPLVGLDVLIASFRFKKPVLELTRAALPYMGLLLLSQIFITYWPDLSLIILRLMGKPY